MELSDSTSLLTMLFPNAALAPESEIDGLRLAVYDQQVSPDSGIRSRAALLPLLKRSQTEAESIGELRLRQTRLAAHGSHVDAAGDQDGARGESDLPAEMRYALFETLNDFPGQRRQLIRRALAGCLL